MKIDISAIKEAAKAATPGPYRFIGGKCLAGVVAPNCQIYLHDARPDMFASLPRWQATALHFSNMSPAAVLAFCEALEAALIVQAHFDEDVPPDKVALAKLRKALEPFGIQAKD